MSKKQIALCAMPHAGGWHWASWRRPGTAGNDIWNPELWRQIAVTAENAKLDAVFLADNLTLWTVPEHLRHHTAKVGGWDATVLATVMAGATSQIGIIATAHTEYQQPYILARQFACLDHASRGRSGWNVVTSGTPNELPNFRQGDPPTSEQRYARATEFIEVVKGLWDSWEDDAYVVDQDEGVFYDPSKLHLLQHTGEHYSVRGPLNVMRPPQGHPVIAQAGGSQAGKQLAGGQGELVFTPLTGHAAAQYRQEILTIAAKGGRSEGAVKTLSQLMPVVGETQAQAEEKWKWLQSQLHPDLARGQIAAMLGIDLAEYPMDEPLPDDLGSNAGIQGYREAVQSFRKPDGTKPTIRELLNTYRGPGTVVGDANTVADYMEAEIDSGACDGFVLLLQGVPEELNDFVRLVVPELQRRGRFRTEYESSTLRERFGFERPSNRNVR